jgi:hypothetical protein
MRKLILSVVLSLAALAISIAPALAGSIGPTP